MKAKPVSFVFLVLVLLLIAACTQAPIATQPEFEFEETIQDYADDAGNVQMKIRNVQVEDKKLIVELTISGLQNVVEKDADFSNRVCDPLLSLDPGQSVTKVGSTVDDLTKINDWSEPIDVSYTYELKEPLAAQTSATMDWTIGPCGPCFDEQNIPCDVFPLVTNHRFNFVIPEK
jgi:hypothetical protein